jgi:hypothetical protein
MYQIPYESSNRMGNGVCCVPFSEEGAVIRNVCCPREGPQVKENTTQVMRWAPSFTLYPSHEVSVFIPSLFSETDTEAAEGREVPPPPQFRNAAPQWGTQGAIVRKHHGGRLKNSACEMWGASAHAQALGQKTHSSTVGSLQLGRKTHHQEGKTRGILRGRNETSGPSNVTINKKSQPPQLCV